MGRRENGRKPFPSRPFQPRDLLPAGACSQAKMGVFQEFISSVKALNSWKQASDSVPF